MSSKFYRILNHSQVSFHQNYHSQEINDYNKAVVNRRKYNTAQNEAVFLQMIVVFLT